MTVRLTHPDVGAPYYAEESTVPYWVGRGWVADPDTPPGADPTAYVVRDSLVYDARNHGVVGNGVADDQPALQTVVNTLSAAYVADGRPRRIWLPGGRRYRLQTGIKWATGVGLMSDGSAVLVPVRMSGLVPAFSAIYNHTDGSAEAPLTDCLFEGFEIDGSGVTLDPGSYDVGAKGINILHMLRARFVGLHIHDTHASGIGSDQLRDSVIRDCVLERCGAGNDGTQPGGAGIGIGTGLTAHQSLLIEGNTARDCGTHGIFVEHQPGLTTRTVGVRIIGNHVQGNRYGISDWGADALEVVGNTFVGNEVYGFGISADGVAGYCGANGVVTKNVFTAEQGDSIRVGDGITRYVITDNLIKLGLGCGMKVGNEVNPAATNQEITIAGNEIVACDQAGIRVDATLNHASIERNRVRNNGRATGGAADARSGITLNAAVDRATIRHNTCWDNQGTKTQQYGLYVTDTAAVTSARVEGNDLPGNAVAAARLPAAGVGLLGSPERRFDSTTLAPSATANTAGTPQTATPGVGKLWFTSLCAVRAIFGGTFGSETATVTFTATYNDGTSASTTLTRTSAGTQHIDDTGLTALHRDGKHITQVAVDLRSTIASSLVTATVNILATQD